MKNSPPRLKRDLGLVDVFAISTGAMFSSGFFLLPGLAFGLSGSWVVMAYAVSALLVVPAMLSKAELASAMPKAGGTYYFLDRSMGPLLGTVGGLGTWVAMGLKNTFALIGMGAYLALVVDLDITAVALALTVVFTAFNILGAKETAGLQRILVFSLVVILGALVVAALWLLLRGGPVELTSKALAAAPGKGIDGFLATVGLVFVSYAGLTKAASVAEEIENPDRNLIRGMVYSLLTAASIYVLGSFALVLFVDHASLPTDLTPIATIAPTVFSPLPASIAVIVVLVAAVAAFASTANAGIMSASRYLLAMGRDHLVPSAAANIGSRGTPVTAVLVSSAFIVIALLTLDVLTVAKLASAFQLLIFALVNIAVIVMREARLDAYDPVYRTPFYPWVQLVGVFASIGLIIEMGQVPMLFSLALVALCVVWFFFYGKDRVQRRGAILHWFERLGRDRFDPLSTELRTILREKGLRDEDPYDDIIQTATFLDLPSGSSFETVVDAASAELSKVLHLTQDEIVREFLHGTRAGATVVDHGVALPHFRISELEQPVLVAARVREGVAISVGEDHISGKRVLNASALFFLVSPEEKPTQHLRILAKIASLVVDDPAFLEVWNAMQGSEQLRSLLGSSGGASCAQ